MNKISLKPTHSMHFQYLFFFFQLCINTIYNTHSKNGEKKETKIAKILSQTRVIKILIDNNNSQYFVGQLARQTVIFSTRSKSKPSHTFSFKNRKTHKIKLFLPEMQNANILKKNHINCYLCGIILTFIQTFISDI